MKTCKTPILALTPMLVLMLAAAVPALADDTTPLPHKGLHVFGKGTVRNAPCSAQLVNERQQVLGDGNQISERRDTSVWYRDSAGRTRLEMRGKEGELRLVTIKDPVAGAAWTLDPVKRSAFRMPLRGHMGGEDIIVKRVERPDGEVHVRRDVRIHVPQAAAVEGAPLGQALATALGDARWRKNTVTKDLGTRTLDGVKAEGKLRSYEIPAGEIGNRNAIVVSNETWYAPELQITLYTRHSDPRSGDTVFRLENVKREEPAAALFGVPSDYTIREGESRRGPQ